MSLTDQLVACWNLDESSGNAIDSVGGFTLTNNNSVAYSPGVIRNGADFGASNTNKSLSSTATLGIGNGPCSLMIWVKPTSLPPSDSDPTSASSFYCLSIEDGATAVTYNLIINNVSGDNRINFFRGKQGVGGDFAYGSYTTPTTDWTQIIGTYDGTTLKVYVNGILQATTSTASGNGTGGVSDIHISGRRGGTALLSGQSDIGAIWSRALTQTEVTQSFYNGAGFQWPFMPSSGMLLFS